MARLTVVSLFLLWFLLVAYGAYAFATTAPTDIGFTRGANRVGEFFKWQGAALAVAIIAWLMRGAEPSPGPALRWAGRLPLLLSGGFFLALVVFYAAAVFILPK